MFSRDLGLDAAPGVAVARNGDGPFHGDAEALKALVVFRDAIVHVNKRGGNVAIAGEGVVGRKLFGFLPGGWINGKGGLFELGGELHFAVVTLAIEKFKLAFLGRGK